MSLSGEREEGVPASKMHLSGEREEGGPASKMHLSGGHDTKAKSPIKQERPASPVPSCVSMKSDKSMYQPEDFREGDFNTEQSVEHGGENRMKPGLRKYVCDLTLDLNTVDRLLSLSEENRKVTYRREEQPYPDHPERFEDCGQVLCREGLTGRCYWEVEWIGREADIGVTYKGISRRGGVNDCCLGYNDKSWSLNCSDNSYTACYNYNSNYSSTTIFVPSSYSHRVGVYLDWPAGTLSFYRASSDTLTHLKTFTSTFTEPLYPGFRVHADSSVSLK